VSPVSQSLLSVENGTRRIQSNQKSDNGQKEKQNQQATHAKDEIQNLVPTEI
jgi:hypothetical protein